MAGKNKDSRKRVYARFEKDGSITYRDVGKGRPPTGYIRCAVNEDGTLESDKPDVDIPDGAKISVVETHPSTVSIQASEPCSIEKFRSFVRPMRVETRDRIISLIGCDIIGKALVEFFDENRVHSRIDIHLDTGDILVWTTIFKPGEPDVVIGGCVEPRPAKV